MIVVSDTSPVLNLAAIQKLDLLRVLSQRVIIPPAVARELRRNSLDATDSQRLAIQPLANEPAAQGLLSVLDLGESEAIVLALEQKADLLLIDERRGRRIATSLGLRVLGLLGLLAEAKRQGAVEKCKPILDELVASGFWIGKDLYARLLREVGEVTR